MNNKKEIITNREKINQIDLELLDLLNNRAKLSFEIRKSKLEKNMSLYDPKREQDILERITLNNKGPIHNEDIKKIFTYIIKTMREADFE